MRIQLCLAAAFLATASVAHAAEDVSALLKRQTQEFSDAGQIGDTKTMDRLLDPDVVFFNESGDSATKADLTTAGPPRPKTISVKMTVTDWHVQVHGNVAVASFIDDQVENFHGAPVHAQFRSVETWLKEGADWRMIGSQTIALQQDPPSVTLPAKTLDEYAGTYQVSPDEVFVLTRKGHDLYAQVTGGEATLQKAELRDVLFTPGHPRFRKIFQRDNNGKITGFAYRREGRDILFKRIG